MTGSNRDITYPILAGGLNTRFGGKTNFRRAVVNTNTPDDLKIVENMYLDRG